MIKNPDNLWYLIGYHQGTKGTKVNDRGTFQSTKVNDRGTFQGTTIIGYFFNKIGKGLVGVCLDLAPVGVFVLRSIGTCFMGFH